VASESDAEPITNPPPWNQTSTGNGPSRSGHDDARHAGQLALVDGGHLGALAGRQRSEPLVGGRASGALSVSSGAG